MHNIKGFVPHKMDLFIMLLICVVMSPSWANPNAGSPWRSPCSSRRRVPTHQMVTFDYGVHDPAISLRHYKHEMKIATRRARETARRIFRHIIDERLPSILHNECMNGGSLPGIHSAQASLATSSNRYSSLPEDFRRLAVLTVFVQEAASNITYHRRMEILKRHLLQLMCVVETTSLTMGQTIQYDVTHGILAPQPDEGQRDRQNCLIVRNTYDVLDSMATRYWPHSQ